MSDTDTILRQIQQTLSALQNEYRGLAASVEAINGRVNVLAGVKASLAQGSPSTPAQLDTNRSEVGTTVAAVSPFAPGITVESNEVGLDSSSTRRPSPTSRIILTTYPGQAGIDPLKMDWGHSDPMVRGPVVVSRNPTTVGRRNGELRGTFFRLAKKLTKHKSHWCPWRCILHISCISCGKQKSRHRPCSRLHQHGACC